MQLGYSKQDAHKRTIRKGEFTNTQLAYGYMCYWQDKNMRRPIKGNLKTQYPKKSIQIFDTENALCPFVFHYFERHRSMWPFQKKKKKGRETCAYINTNTLEVWN